MWMHNWNIESHINLIVSWYVFEGFNIMMACKDLWCFSPDVLSYKALIFSFLQGTFCFNGVTAAFVFTFYFCKSLEDLFSPRNLYLSCHLPLSHVLSTLKWGESQYLPILLEMKFPSPEWQCGTKKHFQSLEAWCAELQEWGGQTESLVSMATQWCVWLSYFLLSWFYR